MRMNRPLSPHVVSKGLDDSDAQGKARPSSDAYSKFLSVERVMRAVRRLIWPHPIKEAVQLRCVTFHSIKEARFHNNWLCSAGGEVAARNIMQGTGGKPLCENCAKLNAEAN
jgi:formylmethanofuran dehydrogenase subunit E